MQDSKLINISQAVVGKQGVYSIEFHEDQHYTHVKRSNSDGSETLFSVGGGGGGTTYTAGTDINIVNGVISGTYDWSLFGDTGDIDPVNSSTQVQIVGGNNVTTSISGNTLTIDSSFTDTNDFVSSVFLNGTDLEFNGTGGAFSGKVSLASLGGGSGTASNIVPTGGGTINTDTVGIYGLRQSAEKIELARTVSSDTSFVLQAESNILGTNNFGILVVYVAINCSGSGGINLQYKNLLGSNTPIHGSSHLTSGNYALTFSYFGDIGLQLLAFTEL
jgi:hypothetical protein